LNQLTEVTLAQRIAENARCLRSLAYLCCNYIKILSKDESGEETDWVPFDLWPAQVPVAEAFDTEQLVVALKARQIGWSWLGEAKILKQSIFYPNSLCLLYSLRDTEAQELLTRLVGMERNLPPWMRLGCKGNAHTLVFGNGSRVRALPTTAGDSYTASIVMVDEADLVADLGTLLRRVKPTVDNGGQLLLISRANKDLPESMFKRIYRGARDGENKYFPIFCDWRAHPGRTQQWYEDQVKDSLTNTGSLDFVHEQYPNTDIEALAPHELNKRLSPAWCQKAYEELTQLIDIPPELPGLKVWELPKAGTRYVIGVDVAEGKETSDDSAAVVLDTEGNQVAEVHAKIEIAVFADFLHALSRYYNNAGLMVERNNHGHAVILDLKNRKARLLHSRRDKNVGHLSDSRGKAEMYASMAEHLKDEKTKIRSSTALYQLMSIERSTLRAPEGLLDDVADAYAIACVALERLAVTTGGSFELI